MSVGRIVMVVAGALGLVLALVLIAGAAALFWVNAAKSEDGFFTSGDIRLGTGAYAVVSESFNVAEDLPAWLLNEERIGEVRINAASRQGDVLFLGVAPSVQLDQYLSGVPYDEIADIQIFDDRASYRRHDGAREPAPPTEQAFWDASTFGPEPQTLLWTVKQGDWSFVAMNADGSRGMDFDLTAGVRVPFVVQGGVILLVIGIVVAGASGVLFWMGLRRHPEARTSAWTR